MGAPFDFAWSLLKAPPKPDFPYYGDPEKFYLEHSITPWEDNDGKQQQTLWVRAMQGLDEHEMEPMQYGHASFSLKDGKLIPKASYTHPSFRRHGIASDIYDHAEKVTGLPVANDSLWQSDDARAFWQNRESGKQ